MLWNFRLLPNCFALQFARTILNGCNNIAHSIMNPIFVCLFTLSFCRSFHLFVCHINTLDKNRFFSHVCEMENNNNKKSHSQRQQWNRLYLNHNEFYAQYKPFNESLSRIWFGIQKKKRSWMNYHKNNPLAVDLFYLENWLISPRKSFVSLLWVPFYWRNWIYQCRNLIFFIEIEMGFSIACN